MNQGQIVEIADTDIIYRQPAHAFTRSLLDAIPGRLRLNATGIVSN
jgi:ABC-type oligopeptide transport system ATPase subunit